MEKQELRSNSVPWQIDPAQPIEVQIRKVNEVTVDLWRKVAALEKKVNEHDSKLE